MGDKMVTWGTTTCFFCQPMVCLNQEAENRGETMLKIAVLDDEPLFLDRFVPVLEKQFDGQEEIHISVFHDSTPFRKSASQFDLIFLDIDIPDVSGIEIASELRQNGSRQTLIFVSGYEHFVFESIRCKPFRFIRKELFQSELPEAVESWLAEHKKAAMTFSLPDKSGHEQIYKVSETIAFYVVRHDVYLLHSVRGSVLLPDRTQTLERLEQNMQEFGFLRVHKSWLVNFRFIHQIRREEILLKNGEIVPMSRRRSNEIRQQYSILMREGEGI